MQNQVHPEHDLDTALFLAAWHVYFSCILTSPFRSVQACLWTPAELSGWLDKKGMSAFHKHQHDHNGGFSDAYMCSRIRLQNLEQALLHSQGVVNTCAVLCTCFNTTLEKIRLYLYASFACVFLTSSCAGQRALLLHRPQSYLSTRRHTYRACQSRSKHRQVRDRSLSDQSLGVICLPRYCKTQALHTFIIVITSAGILLV